VLCSKTSRIASNGSIDTSSTLTTELATCRTEMVDWLTRTDLEVALRIKTLRARHRHLQAQLARQRRWASCRL
jgi:hypothetical protein